MTLIMAMLSVLAVWIFLLVLVFGLLIIWKALESVRGSMEKIAMGVRAIEKETDPLAAHAGTLADGIQKTNQVVGAASQGLSQLDSDLGAAAPLLRPSR